MARESAFNGRVPVAAKAMSKLRNSFGKLFMFTFPSQPP